MKAVILAGGLGTRLSEETVIRPKPMVEIGGKPILWHIMKIYSAPRRQRFRHLPRLQGLHDQGVLRQLLPAHVRRHLRPGRQRMEVHQQHGRALEGHAGRHRRGHDDRRPAASASALPATSDEPFCFTYGDGVADIDISAPRSRSIAQHGRWPPSPPSSRRAASARSSSTATVVDQLREKPRGDGGWINGGFFVLSPEVLRSARRRRHRLGAASRCERLARDGQLRGLSPRRLLAADGHAARPQRARELVGRRARRRGDCMVTGIRQVDPRSGAAGASSSPATPGSRAAGCRCGCRRWAPRLRVLSSASPPSPRCTSWRGSARACATSEPTSATPRPSPTRCARATRRWSSTWPPSRWCATRSPIRARRSTST